MVTAYPRTSYSAHLAIAAIRRAVGNPYDQRLSDPGDLRGAADLGWCECVQRWQSDRASLGTFAWPRMNGRVRDLQRAERHQRRVNKHYAEELQTAPHSSSPSWTEPLSLRQAIEHSRQEMTPAEQAVLHRVYRQGGTLIEAAKDCSVSEDAVHRAHRRLLARLRAAAGVAEPAPTAPEAAKPPAES